ncbi:Catabolite control protein A [Paenibacillus konkukensis]|uniref:Catabolite control protein A n=1 Tax=Paenibacillus konkukensis TaxID=2020716 RepID=A0ABY4RMJ0_9BACL|nr:LacI family DNA-binding transcriptional regulator [Paenibacillus konkukensis]UQZ83697.1 Catabolite control protein A [Paenibacillus konkukensis]
MKKRVTIHDIARIAGVSPATVSRVLSKSSYPVSSDMRKKIERLAEEHDYIPNMVGKQLKTHKNMTIGVIVPTISNPFYSSVVLGIEEMARRNNYHVFLCNSLQNPKQEDEYLEKLFENQVKGVVLSSISFNRALLTRLIKLGLKVIAIDQPIDLQDVFQIKFDYRKGGYMATQYLLDKGHRRIAFITAPLDRPSRQSIFDGYRDALQDAGIAVEERLVNVSEPAEGDETRGEFENGKLLTRRLFDLDELPTAVFACNDMTALGVINELTAHGVKIPEQMSVVGFDNIDFSQMIAPPLTTIHQPSYEMGKLAYNMLMELMGGGQAEIDIVLQPKLIERSTVAVKK